VVSGLRLMMHVDGNVLLLRPLVGSRVVLVDETRRTAAARPRVGRAAAGAARAARIAPRRRLRVERKGSTRRQRIEPETADDIELAVDHRAVELFFRLGKRRGL